MKTIRQEDILLVKKWLDIDIIVPKELVLQLEKRKIFNEGVSIDSFIFLTDYGKEIFLICSFIYPEHKFVIYNLIEQHNFL